MRQSIFAMARTSIKSTSTSGRVDARDCLCFVRVAAAGFLLVVESAGCSSCVEVVDSPAVVEPGSGHDSVPERCANRREAIACLSPAAMATALSAIRASLIKCIPTSPDLEEHVPATAVVRLEFDGDGGMQVRSVEKEFGVPDTSMAACVARVTPHLRVQQICPGRFGCTLKLSHAF